MQQKIVFCSKVQQNSLAKTAPMLSVHTQAGYCNTLYSHTAFGDHATSVFIIVCYTVQFTQQVQDL